jgi:tetratricopeptide (TPR) repeat protein
VLQHHPDRSSDPASKAIFLSVTESYDVLSNPEERRRYDDELTKQTMRSSATQQASRPGPQPSATKKQPAPTHGAVVDTSKSRPSPREPSIAEEVQRLAKLYQTGRQAEAEAKAKAILKKDGRQPMPYAILGDIARSKGNVNEAAKMYAYAMQMDPRNALYERRYNEILKRSQVVSDPKRTRLEVEDKKVLVPMVGGAVVILTAIYLGLSQEQSPFGWIPLISTWTLTSLVCFFVSGVTVGAALSIGNLVERYGEVNTTSTGKFSPMMALGCVSMVQFWFAAIVYGAAGLAQRAWDLSMTRLIAGVAAATVAMSFAAYLNLSLRWEQVFVWGGNVIYLGALCGWIIADAFR